MIALAAQPLSAAERARSPLLQLLLSAMSCPKKKEAAPKRKRARRRTKPAGLASGLARSEDSDSELSDLQVGRFAVNLAVHYHHAAGVPNSSVAEPLVQLAQLTVLQMTDDEESGLPIPELRVAPMESVVVMKNMNPVAAHQVATITAAITAATMRLPHPLAQAMSLEHPSANIIRSPWGGEGSDVMLSAAQAQATVAQASLHETIRFKKFVPVPKKKYCQRLGAGRHKMDYPPK